MRLNIATQLFILLVASLSATAFPEYLDETYEFIVALRPHWNEITATPQFGERCDWSQMNSTVWDAYHHIHSRYWGREPLRPTVSNHGDHTEQITW
ncbi:hypothetical protein FRC02_008510 [Tulasnella sp. 418]|nr:hypothetical protein FRC02_008510 [Tulasnella sp. 418]